MADYFGNLKFDGIGGTGWSIFRLGRGGTPTITGGTSLLPADAGTGPVGTTTGYTSEALGPVAQQIAELIQADVAKNGPPASNYVFVLTDGGRFYTLSTLVKDPSVATIAGATNIAPGGSGVGQGPVGTTTGFTYMGFVGMPLYDMIEAMLADKALNG